MLREVFNFNISWGYEIAAFWAVIIVFLAMPHNIYEKADLRVGVIYDMLGGKIKAFIDVIHFFCTSFVLYGMTIALYQYITRLGKYRQPATNFTNGFFFGIIGVGIIVSSLELIARIIDVLITLKGDKNTDNKLRNMNGDTL